MKTRTVSIINNVAILASDVAERSVPVKPICEALEISFPTQYRKLTDHPIFSSVIALRATTGADGKQYEMVCLPIEFLPGWLFSIHPDNVKPEARDNLIEFQLECHRALFEYFFGKHVERDDSVKKTIELKHEMNLILNKKVKTGEDFERYLEIDRLLKGEKNTRVKISRNAFIEMRDLFHNN